MVSLFAEEEFSAPDIEKEVDAAEGVVAEISPRLQPDLFGHEEAESALLNDFNTGRMPHAIILAGQDGIGKATLAYRLARFLFTQGTQSEAGLFGEPEKPSSLFVTAEHPVFRRVASGGHADLKVVEREFDAEKGKLKKNISAESAREIAPFLRKTASEGGWRVVIVDGAEDLNDTSQNALLKILEEPPAKAVLILTTTQPGAFLPTIRSRCRLLKLQPLSEKTCGQLLDKYASGISAEEKIALGRLSGGSIGKALKLHQNKGVALYKDLLKAVSTLPDLDLVLVHELAEKIGKFGAEDSYEAARDILTGWSGRIARAKARGHVMTDIFSGDAVVFEKLASAYPPAHFLNVHDKMSQLFRQTEAANLDKKQAILGAFLMLQKPDYQGLNLS